MSVRDIYEAHHAEHREEGFSIMKDERGELLRKFIGTGKTILDIGCRDGSLTESFAKGNEILGVDVDETSLKKAKDTLGINTLAVDLNGDWSELKESKFDFIVAGEIIEHLYYPEKVIAKVKTHLKEGGQFLGSVPNAFSLKNRLRYLLGRKKYTPLSDPTHINHFSYSELKAILDKHFSNVEIIGLGRYSKLSRLFPGIFAFILFFKVSD